ncbi:hypothetical protein IMG5_204790 [Ichthyophthirius multifiliis]|uniref:Transmembrane protein n=1 Tax=Ichthyophthirius multifiliis TaxID=5932 RepID=G0R6I4_ICHMU|nr:hypothetical protein IMG5_204790 [Ichthyophthirius multifiliis]EGR26921.1 hypothetical protein IMG5_204790 [Ichthyophthirius multifiliis]|eukprot:XP_004023805.1 hypothetical protein IMG5_204790 [Ichthyophthirius multifiliis]
MIIIVQKVQKVMFQTVDQFPFVIVVVCNVNKMMMNVYYALIIQYQAIIKNNVFVQITLNFLRIWIISNVYVQVMVQNQIKKKINVYVNKDQLQIIDYLPKRDLYVDDSLYVMLVVYNAKKTTKNVQNVLKECI